jgi:23S rRNA (guanosine2251-2'-O)-methyltransferase
VGAEGEGVSRLVRERCDFVVSLPMQGHISSLNASVAAGIILYEIARQRMGL